MTFEEHFTVQPAANVYVRVSVSAPFTIAGECFGQMRFRASVEIRWGAPPNGTEELACRTTLVAHPGGPDASLRSAADRDAVVNFVVTEVDAVLAAQRFAGVTRHDYQAVLRGNLEALATRPFHSAIP